MPKILFYRATAVFDCGNGETVIFSKSFSNAYPLKTMNEYADECQAGLQVMGINPHLVGVNTQLEG